MHRLSLSCALILIALAACLPGCQKPLGPGALNDASHAYTQGQYRQAYQTAARLAGDRTVPPARRQEAAFIAGLAAQEMGNRRTAQGHLLHATQTSDLSLKGDAFASLGLSYAQDERYVESARAMLRAAEFLQGQEQANAYYHAGIAQQKLGQFAQARTSLSLARAASDDPAFQDQVNVELNITGYTLQLGAFRKKDNARTLAEQVAQRTISLQLGAPRVIEAQDPSGGQLQLVQVGQFSTFASARDARDKLDRRDIIIVPLR